MLIIIEWIYFEYMHMLILKPQMWNAFLHNLPDYQPSGIIRDGEFLTSNVDSN